MAEEDAAHLARIRALPCARCQRPPPSEAHHRTGAGMALRAHDHDAMPLCASCHRDLHAMTGRFRTWTRHQLRVWQQERVVEMRSRFFGSDDDVF